MKSIDLTNNVYGRLTVLGVGKGSNSKKKYWKCLCSCGNITNVETSKLKSLKTISCGCSKKESNIKDIEGKLYNNLTAIKFEYTKNNKAYWSFRCSCGKVVTKQAKLVRNGHITSCGCARGKNRIQNLKGKTFGRLFVKSFAYSNKGKTYWNCLCVCGNNCIVSSSSLKKGNTQSCGCLKRETTTRIDITGQKFGKLTVIKYLRTEGKEAFWLCKCDCGNEKEVKGTYLRNKQTKSCGCVKTTSFEEKEVLDFVKSIYKGYVIENDRTTIAPKELDIYIPEKKFAIEYDGLYWHSEAAGCTQMHHWNKTKMCLDKGIRLLHIYSSEWRDKQDICKSMIASALGVYERKEFARNCEVKEVIDKKIAIDFFNENHIQGAVHNYSLCLGLYKDNELLQAVVFGKQHFGKKGTIELYRMVTKKNTQVIGGFSKLMKHSPYDTVVSYVALRLFDAKGYLAGNWKIEHRSQPSFDITDGANLYTRHLFKKERCLKMFTNVTEDMTEREMQIKNGFYKVWDCGTYKVVWNRP